MGKAPAIASEAEAGRAEEEKRTGRDSGGAGKACRGERKYEDQRFRNDGFIDAVRANPLGCL